MEYHYDHPIDLNDPEDLYSKIIRMTGRNKEVLDIGCGSGQIGEILTRQFACKVTGLELDEGACSIAKDKLWKVVTGNAERLDLAALFQAGSMDVILCLDVLEHMIDPWSFMQRVKLLLRSDGYLLATIPNAAHASVVLELLAGKFQYRDLGLLDKNHVRFFTLDSVEELFISAGYRIDILDRNKVDVKYLELLPGAYGLPPEITSFVNAQPESDTYQFIVKARPA